MFSFLIFLVVLFTWPWQTIALTVALIVIGAVIDGTNKKRDPWA